MAWIANLSNGETLTEGEVIAGERTPWQKLLAYMRHNDLKMTALRLSVGNVSVEAMPHKLCDGYFHAYEAKKRFYGSPDRLEEIGTSTSQGVGSVIGDKVYITWIDLKPTRHMYTLHQEIRPLSTMRIHTTIND